MKEFRIAECINDNGVGTSEYAIFADGSEKRRISVHEEYGKYFEVDNELNKDSNQNNILKYSFTNRIKDAIETIRQGNGDTFATIEFAFLRTHSVVYFLNRKIGEELRQKTLDEFKDTKFGWVIRYGGKNSFSGYYIMDTNMCAWFGFNDPDGGKIKAFNTRGEAQKYIDSILSEALDYAKRLSNKMRNAAEEEKSAVFHEISCEIQNRAGGKKFSALLDFTIDMLTGQYELKNDKAELDEYGYDIIQYPINEHCELSE